MRNVGDGLAKAVDSGIPVIITNYAQTTNYSTCPAGRFSKEDYLAVKPKQNNGGTMNTCNVNEKTSYTEHFKEFFKNQGHGLGGFGSHNFQTYCSQPDKPMKGVVFAVTGKTNNNSLSLFGGQQGGFGQGGDVPLVAIREDKNALVMNINTWCNDSYPNGMALLACCIKLALDGNVMSPDYVDDQIKAFEIAKEKKQFGGCVDAVKNIQRVLKSNQKRLGV
eukprot:UN24346